ncbi:MAG: hypothetical protein UT61_C0010G0007 [Candidatus Woesebacteria bacterium GW2011_GWA1_39_8]|jgi:hypothetical protein|uniref:Uncharacterized protein n=1 Tax=Candidatus Woesebacteria bacterium GW2011_GWA1_39_8 TaxID=1618552 RepID=A0A0G0PQ04_9BACT|nr:MAG: hypothetical protein UT61_C0010G0007 [Candidatus Woesebacteria bacterium GW2011_GWA1_39_8]
MEFDISHRHTNEIKAVVTPDSNGYMPVERIIIDLAACEGEGESIIKRQKLLMD